MCSGITAMIRSGCGQCSYQNMTENTKPRTVATKNHKKTGKTTKKQKKVWIFLFSYAIIIANKSICLHD